SPPLIYTLSLHDALPIYHLQGVNPDTGLFEFEDYNGDGLITSTEDRQYVADLTPKMYGGFSNTMSYKKWHLDFLFQFVKKQGFKDRKSTRLNSSHVKISY